MSHKYRVLIIDDSAFVRHFLTELFNRSKELETVTAVSDPTKAFHLLKTEKIDVITLDMEMPNMDGLSFLHYLMRFNPKPVVLFSVWAQKNSQNVLEALSLGAMDFVEKPHLNADKDLQLLEEEIVAKVTAAAKAKMIPTLKNTLFESLQNSNSGTGDHSDRIIAIGASTGGTVALTRIFKELQPNLPAIIVIQHMPPLFTGDFAQTLSRVGKIPVSEGVAGQILYKGTAVVVPGGKNLAVKRISKGFEIKIGMPDTQSFYNPSIDFTMNSIAELVGNKAMGVILTGMGNDGAKGLRLMSDRGAYTVAQDEESSVIYGMPQKAVEYGGVQKVAHLDEIPRLINEWGSS